MSVFASRRPIGAAVVTTLLLFGYSPSAGAADIAAVVGAPGTASWDVACGPGRTQPSGTSQLTACSGPIDECLHRVEIDTSNFPNAVCADGTPGTFYIREGIGADADRWVVHVQGGGACRDYDSCLERWCGQQGGLPYTANKMSSDWDGDGSSDLLDHAEAGGMAVFHPSNDFHTWTHVFAYYCSADSWQGRATDVTFTDGVDAFDLDARGHTILSAMRRMLRKNNANPAWTAVDDYTVPDIDDATEIVFTGTSAGAAGAIHNVDWFLTPFATTEAFVLDANMDTIDSVNAAHDVWVDTDLDGVGDETLNDYRIDQLNAKWDPGGYYDLIDAFTDSTCRTTYESIGRMDRCSLISLLLLLNVGGAPIIETETFVRVDLEDSVLGKGVVQHPNPAGTSIIVGGANGTPATPDDFVSLMRDTLVALYDDHDTVTNVFGPRCGQHVGLESTTAFASMTTPDTDDAASPPSLIVGTDSNLHDAIVEWLNLGGVGFVSNRRLDTDDPAGGFSGC